MSNTVAITDIEQITHDVKQFTFEKPDGFSFEPGQATEVSIDKDGWRNAGHPFTFTSLNEDPYLQFTIKIYEEHHGLTEQIGKLKEGDAFIIDDPWGTIQYKGPGVFLAGGAGVTPFIAILRKLYKDGSLKSNRLMFSNKRKRDIILHDEFKKMLGADFINTLTEEEQSDEFHTQLIDRDFLEAQIEDFDQHFYVCGPPEFVDDMQEYLEELDADPDGLVFEE